MIWCRGRAIPMEVGRASELSLRRREEEVVGSRHLLAINADLGAVLVEV